jgi:1-acyl-sn-glycerol-3-phosphate acyltransferase
MSQFGLLRLRRFGPFFWTQLCGALNDNLLKNAFVILFTFGALGDGLLAGDTLVNLSAGLFIAPFFLFSATAGQLADKLEKARLIRIIKLAEIGIVALAAVALARQSVSVLLAVLFLLGTHSAFFSPVKYSLLPQHLREQELVGGNALVQMGTFVAILAGTILGGALMSLGHRGPAAVAATAFALAIVGWLTSRAVPAALPRAPELRVSWNPLAETLRTVALTRENRTVFLSILGISWFWFYGALFLAQFPGLGREVLGGNEHVVTLLLLAFSLGVALGCLLCERLSEGKIELGLVPLGSLGLSIFAFDLFFAAGAWAPPAAAGFGVHAFFAAPGHWRILADLVLLGVFGGFYIVPLQALVQHRSAPHQRARVIAGNGILNAFFMVLAAVLALVLRGLGLSIPELILVSAIVNVGVALYIYSLVPEFLMRFLVWLLVHTVYRLRKRGLEHVPDEGAAVLVCNHVSYVDALVISAACRRPIRFVMNHHIFRIPILRFVFKTGRAIPIAPRKEDARQTAAAFEEIARGLELGDLICIFPEGRLTQTGEIDEFRSGIEEILARTPVPVIPMALRGLWGSFFSRKGGPAMWKRPRRFWSRIEIVCGMAIPPAEATAAGLHARVLALRGDAA